MMAKENKHLSEIEKQFFEHVKKGILSEVKQVIGQLNVNCADDDGMTTLMYASYKGNVEMTDYLIANGANVNIDTHKDKYTPLMFATLSGSTDTVRLLLEAGARPDVINNVNRTAAQLGAFVGRHGCVSVINNFVQKDQINYYTKKHGLEEEPRLQEHIAGIVHKFIVIPNLNPIKLVKFIQQNMELIENHKSVKEVLEMECQKSFKDVNEVLSIKVHIFNCVLQKCVDWETNKEGKGGVKGLIKHLLKGRSDDGFLIHVETLIRDSIKSFPYAQSNLFQQLVKTLAPVQPGNEPTALSAITQSINGMQSADFSECCSCCGDRHCFNKCSVCKMVRYCNATCQKLHWPTHKKFCSQLTEQYKKIQEHQKKMKEQEETEAKLRDLEIEKGNLEIEKTKEDNHVEERNTDNVNKENSDNLNDATENVENSQLIHTVEENS